MFDRSHVDLTLAAFAHNGRLRSGSSINGYVVVRPESARKDAVLSHLSVMFLGTVTVRVSVCPYWSLVLFVFTVICCVNRSVGEELLEERQRLLPVNKRCDPLPSSWRWSRLLISHDIMRLCLAYPVAAPPPCALWTKEKQKPCCVELPSLSPRPCLSFSLVFSFLACVVCAVCQRRLALPEDASPSETLLQRPQVHQHISTAQVSLALSSLWLTRPFSSFSLLSYLCFPFYFVYFSTQHFAQTTKHLSERTLASEER